MENPREKSILILLIKIIPLISFVIPSLGLIMLIVLLHRTDYLTKGLDLLLPIIIGSIIILVNNNKLLSNNTLLNYNIKQIKYNKYLYYLLFLLVFIISILICLISTKIPIVYFIATTTLAMLIFIEIIFTETGEVKIISKIILLMGNIIYCQTLRLPLYFGSTDLLDHMSYVNSIVVLHHVTMAMGPYQFFPLYHIFFACSQFITYLNLKTNLFIVSCLIFISTIYFIYLLSYKITLDKRHSLLATFIYSISYETLYAGMYMVTRDMSFVFFLIMLYLILANKIKSKEYLAIGLIVPLVFVHQVSLAQDVIIICTLLFIEWLIYSKTTTINYLFPLLFVVCFLSYWVYTAGLFLDSILQTIKSTTNVVNIPTIVNVALYKFYINNLDSSILVLFIIIGIIVMLIKGYKNNNVLIVLCAVISFLSLPFILPGPAAFFMSLLLSYRIPLMLSPFTIIAVSQGIILILLLKNKKMFLKIIQHSLIIMILSIYILVVQLKIANGNDLYLKNIFPPSDRTYFLSSEINGLDFCVSNLDGTLFTDYESSRYIDAKSYKNVLPNIITYNSLNNSRDSYFFLRADHLNERGQITFIRGSEGFMGVTAEYSANDLENDGMNEIMNNNNLIYENNSVELFDIGRR